MRLIDADAFIKDHFSDEHRIAMSNADKLWMRRIVDNAPTIETESVRWIPVTERLPEEGEKVLTYCKFGHMRDRVYKKLGNTMLFTPDGMVPGRHITHWMPLPDAPGEVDDGTA